MYWGGYESYPMPPYTLTHNGKEYIEEEFTILGQGDDMLAYGIFRRNCIGGRFLKRLKIPASELKRNDETQEFSWNKDN